MKRKHLILISILLIAAILRFYNLLFDAPYFFNPDERNMANAITQFHLPTNPRQSPSCFQDKLNALPLTLNACNLNPHFFAYGQFPLYLAFFSYQTISLLTSLPAIALAKAGHFPLQSISFSDAIFWLRFWSATTSVLTVLLVFLISRLLFQPKADPPRVAAFFTRRSLGEGGALFAAALLAAFSPGLIQSAHFGTTESLLTFFYLALIYLSILYSSKKILTSHFLLLTSLISGLSLSTKISSVLFFPIPLLAIFLTGLKFYKKLLFSMFIVQCSLLIFFLTSPFTFLDHQGFVGSLNYESAVALGKTKVFYTRQFENTTPVLFQAQKIFPYTLGWPIFILGLSGFLLMNLHLVINLIRYIKQKSQILSLKTLFIVHCSLFIYFLPNAFLYAKWTRFMTPVFPLFAVFTGYFLCKLSSKPKVQMSNHPDLIGIVIWILITTCILSGLAFFTIYTRPDTRVAASYWIYQNIPSGSYILSETANVVDIPLPLPNNEAMKQWNNRVISFNFYDLDDNPNRFEELLAHLEKADYIFIPSRRIFANHMRLSDTYPLTSKYYELLFSGNLGFTQVAEINSPGRWPNGLLPGGIDENAEETFTVFDHPVIRIYKKKIPYNQEEYRNLFRI